MKKLDYRVMNADEYIKSTINREMLFTHQKNLSRDTEEGSIGWCFFDKPKFDKRLKKEVRKKYGVNVDLKPYWDMFSKYSPLYVQQDFMKKTYDHTFHLFGKYKDYGAIVFYAKNINTNPGAAKELVRNWFYDVVCKNYCMELGRHLRLKLFTGEPFEFYIRWKPIAKAAVHFDKKLSVDDVKEYIIALVTKEGIHIKNIDDHEIVFQ